jgi:hypothetical protein
VTPATSVEGDRDNEKLRDRPAIRGRATPAKLVVVAVDTADSVSAAGGLIFDAIRAGWKVDIYLESPGDGRALQILGARSVELPEVFEFESNWPDAILLSAVMHERHRGVQRLVATSLRRHVSEIAVWGGSISGINAKAGSEHRLSTAARAFKPHAMHAAGLPPPVTYVESFSGGLPN